jgi:hypothetical protein
MTYMRFLLLTLALTLSQPAIAQQDVYDEVKQAFKYDPYAGSPTGGQWNYAPIQPQQQPALQRNYGIPNPYLPEQKICIIVDDAYGNPHTVCE